MSLERRVAMLEDKIALLEAAVDGSEAQTCEAAAYLLGLVTRYLHEKALIDEVALSRYVSAFNCDPEDADDHMGALVRLFGAHLDFHSRYPADFSLNHLAAEAGSID